MCYTYVIWSHHQLKRRSTSAVPSDILLGSRILPFESWSRRILSGISGTTMRHENGRKATSFTGATDVTSFDSPRDSSFEIIPGPLIPLFTWKIRCVRVNGACRWDEENDSRCDNCAEFATVLKKRVITFEHDKSERGWSDCEYHGCGATKIKTWNKWKAPDVHLATWGIARNAPATRIQKGGWRRRDARYRQGTGGTQVQKCHDQWQGVVRFLQKYQEVLADQESLQI